MASMRMNTGELTRNIGSAASTASANGCAAHLLTLFDEIEKTAKTLDAVWDDEAQRIFMNSFLEKSSRVRLYFAGVQAVLNEGNAAAAAMSAWDVALKNKIG